MKDDIRDRMEAAWKVWSEENSIPASTAGIWYKVFCAGFLSGFGKGARYGAEAAESGYEQPVAR